MSLTQSIHPGYTLSATRKMKTASQPPSLRLIAIACALTASLYLPLMPNGGASEGNSCHAFNLIKKKADGDGLNPESAKDSAKSSVKSSDKSSDKAGKAEKAEKAAADDSPKEKVKGMSKEEIKEEEELTAEYEDYQKQLKASLKSVKTPFGSGDASAAKADEGALGTISLSEKAGESPLHQARQSLRDRLFASKVYMPGRVVIGRPAEFTIKGRPGYWAALAMADKDKGAKPIYGHALRLGPDRKVVALGKIPESGVLSLKIFTPVAGDLVGGNFYFEAAVWPENNLAALEIAQPLSSETQQSSTVNSVAIAGQGERKHGLMFVPDNSSPYAHVNTPGLSSGRP